jgi:hypothetical protein
MAEFFIPTQFGKFGKQISDLFKKKYDFGTKITTIHKADGGVKIEAGGNSKAGDSNLTGFAKLNYKDSSFGEAEGSVKTCGSANGSVTLKNLADGVEVVVKASEKPCGSVKATYAQDFFAGSAEFSANQTKQKLALSGVIGADGLCVGGSIDLDLSGNINDPSEYAIGVQQQRSDYVATVLMTQKGEKVAASWFQTISEKLSVGSTLTFKPEEGSRTMCFASEYALDKDTTIKAKGSTCGTVAGAIEHRLRDPALKFGVAASFDSKKSFANKDFGINLTFGDF